MIIVTIGICYYESEVWKMLNTNIFKILKKKDEEKRNKYFEFFKFSKSHEHLDSSFVVLRDRLISNFIIQLWFIIQMIIIKNNH